jgi:hypothetical protein
MQVHGRQVPQVLPPAQPVVDCDNPWDTALDDGAPDGLGSWEPRLLELMRHSLHSLLPPPQCYYC